MSMPHRLTDLLIISDAHTTDDVDYKWRKTVANKGKGIEIVSQEMAQFELAGIDTKLRDTKNSKGIKLMNFYLSSSPFFRINFLELTRWCDVTMADHRRLVDPPLNSYENKITVIPRLHLKSLILNA